MQSRRAELWSFAEVRNYWAPITLWSKMFRLRLLQTHVNRHADTRSFLLTEESGESRKVLYRAAELKVI